MRQTKTPIGALWALLASLTFSVNDMLIKFLSDGYALHQIVFTRSLTGVLLLAIVIIPLTGGYGALRTRRPGLHLIRALFVVAANLFFYMALADLPLAIVVAIFFIAPFLITIFSVIFSGRPWVNGAGWRWRLGSLGSCSSSGRARRPLPSHRYFLPLRRCVTQVFIF
jgi:drug/metabolite transporter (DMT)-like permease